MNDENVATLFVYYTYIICLKSLLLPLPFPFISILTHHTGTIFSVWEKKTPGPPTVADILRPGREMICAGYCCYGSATEMVLTYGHGQGVQRFTLDPSLGNFNNELIIIHFSNVVMYM